MSYGHVYCVPMPHWKFISIFFSIIVLLNLKLCSLPSLIGCIGIRCCVVHHFYYLYNRGVCLSVCTSQLYIHKTTSNGIQSLHTNHRHILNSKMILNVNCGKSILIRYIIIALCRDVGLITVHPAGWHPLWFPLQRIDFGQ